MAGSQYDITSSPIWAEVQDIVASGKKPVKYRTQGMFHTEKEDIPVTKLVSVDIVRDYVNRVGDHIQVEFMMPLGEYVSRLYPYRTNLEFSVKKTLLNETDGTYDPDGSVDTLRYKAVFLVDKNPVVSGSDVESVDTETLNLKGMVNVKLQLMDRSLEPLRIKTVYGVYRGVAPKKLIYALLGGESAKVKVDGKTAVDGIDIVEPDNTSAREHVVIPSGTPITSLPTFLQEKAGGVYTTGIGTYLQTFQNKKLWFVYPLFNTKRFDKSQDNRLIVYAVPKGRMDGLDRTYSQDGTILKVVVTSEKSYQDSADIDYINKGSGFRMADARAFMKKPAVLSEDGPKGNRARMNFEVAAEDRKDGLNYAPVVSGPSSNPYKEYSRVTGRNIARISVNWENANPDLIYPGMPCKYVFMDQGEMVELTGTVGFIHSLEALQGSSIVSTVYRTVASMVLLCEQKPQIRALPSGQPAGDYDGAESI